VRVGFSSDWRSTRGFVGSQELIPGIAFPLAIRAATGHPTSTTIRVMSSCRGVHGGCQLRISVSSCSASCEGARLIVADNLFEHAAAKELAFDSGANKEGAAVRAEAE